MATSFAAPRRGHAGLAVVVGSNRCLGASLGGYGWWVSANDARPEP